MVHTIHACFSLCLKEAVECTDGGDWVSPLPLMMRNTEAQIRRRFGCYRGRPFKIVHQKALMLLFYQDYSGVKFCAVYIWRVTSFGSSWLLSLHEELSVDTPPLIRPGPSYGYMYPVICVFF